MYLKKLLSIAFAGAVLCSANAQQNNDFGCGVGLEDGALIVDRLLENRARVSQAEIDAFQNSRAIKYLPVKFHVVGDANGNGRVSLYNLMGMLCDMNDDYRTQDIQFYMQGATNSINFMNNSTIYNDGASFSSQLAMNSAKSSGAINVFISASVNNQVASYYTPAGDFVFVLNAMCNSSSSTGTHELGHFFTLPHTFYGWEGEDALQYSPGNVPSSVGGWPVEKVARTGAGANCNNSGDYFCDTPADYLSDRSPCPFAGTLKDPAGVQIDPEESNFMSYFYDACVDSFSGQQKSAIAADVLTRWNSFNPPSVIGTPSGTPSAISPVNGATVELNGDVTISWNATANTTAYIFEMERVFNGVPLGSMIQTIVYTNSITIPQADLDFPRQYSWKVKPLNQYDACGGALSAASIFNTVEPSTSVISHEIFAKNSELTIMDNPVGSSTAELLIGLAQDLVASIHIYAMDGKKVMGMEGLEFQAGDNIQLLDVSSLTNGIYLIVLNTEFGPLQQKLVIQR